MISLTGLKIRTTTYTEPRATQSFYSYTLANTPFYFKLLWDPKVEDDYKSSFSENQIIWDFGDNTTYIGPTASHYYRWPGNYFVKATLFDNFGGTHEVFADNVLTVYNAIPDIVTIGGLYNFDNPFALDAGKKSPPIQILRYNSWQYDKDLKENNYTVNLYASGSNSIYFTVSAYYTSQWSHLKAYTGFIEAYTNEFNVLQERLVNSTQTDSVSIYAEKVPHNPLRPRFNIRLLFYNYQKPGTVFCGTSGTNTTNKNIYFIDQKPSNNKKESFVSIYGSFDTKIFKDENYLKYSYISTEPYGFINTIYSTQFVKTIFNRASSIKITSNGISQEGNGIPNGSLSAQLLNTFDIYPIKFSKTKIPFVLTLKDEKNYTTKCYPMLELGNINEPQLTINNVYVSLIKYNIDGSFYPLTDAIFFSNTAVPVFKESGSYYAGILTYPYEADSVAISAFAYILDKPRNEPSKGYAFLMQPGLDTLRRFRRVPKYGFFRDSDIFTVEFTADVTSNIIPISGGVCITYVPGYVKNPLSGDYVWIADSDRDTLRCVSVDGENLINPIEFDKIRLLKPVGNGFNRIDATANKKSAAPCFVAADSNCDVWVTLRDCLTTFKIDKISGLATKTIVPKIKNEDLYSSKLYTLSSATLSGFVGENLILPSCVDIDKQDNVYISYTHPLCSFISKYDKDGKHIHDITVKYPYTIKEIIVDTQNNLWVTTFNNSPIKAVNNPQTQDILNRVDNLYYYNTETKLFEFFLPFSMLGTLTMDSGGNVWVNSENNLIHRVKADKTFDTFVIGNPQSKLDYVQDFGGLAGDLDGNLLIVNNTEGKLMYYNTIDARQTPLSAISFVTLPQISKMFIPFGSYSFYSTIGDFTGVRWYLKNKVQEITVPKIVNGISTLFSIKDSRKPGIVKKNENFDLSENIKSYILQESLLNTTNLFNNFIDPILNGNEDDLDELGKVIHEKIANFVNNISDIDKCNLRSLKSLYEMLGERLETFFESLPPSMRRIVDNLSVKRCLLFGSKNNFTDNFYLTTFYDERNNNIGRELNIERDRFIAGYPIITYEIFSKKYTVIQNTIVPEQDVKVFGSYPLSAIKYNWGWGLILGRRDQLFDEIKDYYRFYEYIPSKDTVMYDGLVDFSDEMTTITPHNSSYDNWTKFGGLMEYIIGASLYDNMKLAEGKVITPTPTPIPTNTPTPTPTSTPTSTPTPTDTPTPTPTNTPTPTPTNTPTPTPTQMPINFSGNWNDNNNWNDNLIWYE